ncbi:MAG: glycosyltransferase family 39 protein, partial [Myxococcales bacterium]|nr:glycosyltransferase family 39 protein [Myxococcales bacterium]
MSAARRHALAFLAIAFLGVTVRFWGITEAGPYLHDDAVFHAEGWWMSQWWDLAKDSAARKMAEARTGIDWKMHDEALKLFGEPEGRAPLFGRPGMSALVFLMMRAVGVVPWAAPAVSALFGSLIPLLVYGIARTLFDRRTALFAMLFAALGGLELFYDRSGLG